MFEDPAFNFMDITFEEMAFLQHAVTGLAENQMRTFQMIYASKRKRDSDVLMYCILGVFCVVPGIQRFALNQMGMGFLFLFTGGLCWIGSVIDLANHKKLCLEYNKEMAFEAYQIAKMGS